MGTQEGRSVVQRVTFDVDNGHTPEVVIVVGFKICKRYGQQCYKHRVDADVVTDNEHQKRPTQEVGIVSTYLPC